MNLANYITFFRLFIGPLFVSIYINYELWGWSLQQMGFSLIALLAFSELTDVIDGYVARKYNQVTALGKIIDPMADSITRLTVFLTFTQKPISVPFYLILVFLYRESLVSTLRIICALDGFALGARMSGKIKTILQAIVSFAILLLLIGYAYEFISKESLQDISMYLMSIAAAYTAFSATEYFYANRSFIYKIVSKNN